MIGKTTQQQLVLKFVVFMNIQAVKVEAYIFYYIKEPFLGSFVFDILQIQREWFFFTKFFEEYFQVFQVTGRNLANFASILSYFFTILKMVIL